MKANRIISIVLALAIIVCMIPATVLATEETDNIALGKTVTASSSYNQYYTPDNIVDGDTTLDVGRWNSQATRDEEWVLIDLGQSYAVSQIKIRWWAAVNLASSVSVLVSTDGSAFTEIKNYANNTELVNQIDLATPVNAQYVKLVMSGCASNWGYSITEVEVYSQSDTGVAKVDSQCYATVAEAIAEANGKTVKLLTSTDEVITISTDVIIDLAGCTLSNVTVAADATLTLIDTATDDYEGEYGTANITGTVNTFAEVDGKTYMTVGEDGVYSAHCYYVALTHISLDPANDALGYKAKLYGDEVVQSHVQSFGFNLWVDGGQVKTYGKTGTDVVTLRLKNILACNGGEMSINAIAFVTLDVNGNTNTKTGTQQTTTMKETLQKVNAAWTTYTEAQQTAVKALCDQYLDIVSGWELDNIYSIEKDDTLKVLAIGNSFSMDGMEYVYQIAQDMGVEKIMLGDLYIGGCSLDTHYSNLQSGSGAYTYYVNTNGTWESIANYSLTSALESEEWDIITLQQVSSHSGIPDSYAVLPDLIAGVKALCPNAKLGWHMTWAYQADSNHGAFGMYNNDQITMYNAIVSTVQDQILTNEDIDFVIPAGTAIQNARTSYLGDCFTRDGFHLSLDVGRYIAGIAWAEAITGLDATNLTYCPAGMTEEVMTICVESAKNAGITPYAVTTSEYTVDNYYEELDLFKLDLSFSSGYYNSVFSTETPQALYAAQNYYATKIFSKEELPVGTVIVYTGDCDYRPEGWVNGVGTTRPGTVNSTYVTVDEAWWGEYTERGFNIRIADTNVTAEEVAEMFKIYVPRSAYLQLDLSFSGGYYNSGFSTETPQALYAAQNYYATKIFSKEELPVGTMIVYTGDCDYRPEGWVNGAGTTRPGTVNSTYVMVDEAWWGEYTERGFNIRIADTNVTAEEVAEMFKIYVPCSTYQQLDLSLSTGFYNSGFSVETPQAVYAAQNYYATKIFSKEELPVGTVIVYTGDCDYRPEGWVNGVGTTRPGTVNSTYVTVDEAWWGEYTERGFNIRISDTNITAEEVAEMFKIYVPHST